MQYNRAVLLAHAKEVRDDGFIVEIVIWELPEPMSCRVRYDNERRKGDHRHVGDREEEYVFATIEQLLEDFRSDVERWG